MAWDFAALLILILRFAEFTSAIGIWGIAGFIFKDSAAFALFTFQDSVLLLDSHFRILYRCSVYISGFCAGFIFQDSAAFAGFTSQDSALLLDSHFRILQPCWIHISGVCWIHISGFCTVALFTFQDSVLLLDSHFRILQPLLYSHFRILCHCSANISHFVSSQNLTLKFSILLQNNLAIWVRASSSLLNDDMNPAAFWFTNPFNSLINNHVAGNTHQGIWFVQISLETNPGVDRVSWLQLKSSSCPSIHFS